MRKGNIVRLNNTLCFTATNGGGRRFPLSNSYCDDRGVIEGTRYTTELERVSWQKRLSEDIASGKETWHDCAGEPLRKCTTRLGTWQASTTRKSFSHSGPRLVARTRALVARDRV